MKDNKTIAIVIPSLQGNGAERVMLNLATSLQQNGHNVHIIIFKEVIELKYDKNINIHFFKKHYRWIPRGIRGFILSSILDKFIIQHCGNPDLVLSNLLPVDRILSYSRLNVYMVIQNTMSKEITGLGMSLPVMAKIYTRKPTVCCSKGVMKDLISLFSEYKLKKTCYIYSPIDAIFIKNMGCSLPLFPFKNYIIHVGKFGDQKRHDILIKAYHKSGVNEKLVLLTKGSCAIKQKMKILVKSLKIEDKVIFAGFKSNPYPYVKHAKLMVLSSAYEGLPTVILESLVLGTPVISTDCESGPREILPQKNLTPVGDIDALANQIRGAMKNIDNFKTDIDEVFLLENTTNKYLELAE